MAFVDHMKIHATAGKGGDGVVRWLHLRGKDKGGPAGGDGGQGGDIVLEGVRDIGALAAYRYSKKFKAEDGDAGDANNRTGKDGSDTVIRVPVGSVVTNSLTGDVFEVLNDGERTVVFKGGAGGFGNAHFKSSVNQNPEGAKKGRAGQAGDIDISLKLIADVGLIGFPNAGKSSLLNELTHARSKVASYAFTTLDPALGDFYGYVLADIPGLIEGASSGKGLGSRFLKHIERTRILVHLVSAEQEDIVGAYTSIRNELATFDRGLESKREIVILSKTDTLPPDALKKALKELAKVSGQEVIPLSILEPELVKNFSDILAKELKG